MERVEHAHIPATFVTQKNFYSFFFIYHPPIKILPGFNRHIFPKKNMRHHICEACRSLSLCIVLLFAPVTCEESDWIERVEATVRKKHLMTFLTPLFVCMRDFLAVIFYCDIIYHRVSEMAENSWKSFFIDKYWKRLTYGVAYQSIILGCLALKCRVRLL